MMIDKKIFKYLFFILLVAHQAAGQSDLALNQWKSHLSYRSGVQVTQTNDKIVYAAQRGIFTIDKEDLSVRFLSRENGLTDIRASRLFYDPFNQQVIIIYEDSNIDFLTNKDVVNIPFINTNTSILGNKTIHDFNVSAQNFALLATDFGILGFNPSNYEFLFTTFTSTSVNAVGSLHGYHYAATEKGLYAIPESGLNISDFGQWSKIDASAGLPANTAVNNLKIVHNTLYLTTLNQLYKLREDGQFEIIFKPSNAEEDLKNLSVSGQNLVISIAKGNEGKVMTLDEHGVMTNNYYGCVQEIQDAVIDDRGRIWFADLKSPVKYLEDIRSDQCKTLEFSSPYSNEASWIKFKKDKAYIPSNGITEDFQYTYTLYGYYTLQHNTWTNYSPYTFPALNDYGFNHLVVLAPHPKKNEIYLGSFFNGLVRLDEDSGQTEHWNKDNSILQKTIGDETRTRIAGLAFDSNENLWISNFGAEKPIAVLTKDQKWYNFSVPGNTNLHEISIDKRGNKWMPVYGPGNGVIVYHEGSDISKTSDDKVRNINKSNSEIAGNKVNCVAVDLDGAVWVGTDQGPVVFDCGDPFSENCRGTTRKVIVEDIPAPLLRYEDIISIAIDGANRKWFGTRNGIFVQSPDGVTQIAKYDTRTSPLLDNRVDRLSYNPETGEMYIVTPGGIQSIKTTTTGGGNQFASNVYAYPNPVTPDFQGSIAIKGLVRDANVKITDINGRLIYETKALGGQAIWDGYDYNGKKAPTGVYLVFSANENTSLDPNTLVTKILIVK
ncbi:MAG: hypothetical protein LC107_03215 [Chitinophagales bacterium]|nr:hypothetical protein [Chitinophagales bacterium]